MTTLRTLPVPVMIYVVMIMLPVRFMVGPLQMTGLRLYLLVMLLPLLFGVFRRAPALADILLPLFVLWVGICMMVNTPLQAVEHTGAMFLELVGGYFLARSYIRTPQQFQALIHALAALVLLVLPLAIYEAISGMPPVIDLIRQVPGITSVDIVDIAPRLGLERAQVIFAHPIHFGLFCSTAVALFFVGLTGKMSLATRLAGLSLIVLTAFLALSSGAFISVLCQLFLIAWMLVFKDIKHKWWVLLGGLAAAYIFVDLVSNRTPLRVFMSYATFSAHNAYWRGLIFEWGMLNVWQNPVFGLGLNDWVRPDFMYSGSMDNFWLALGVRYGLPGFALLAIAWATGFWRVFNSCNAPANLRRAWLICIIGMTFTLATVHIWTAIYSFTFFLFGAGQWMANRQNTKPAQQTTSFARPLQLSFQRDSGVTA